MLIEVQMLNRSIAFRLKAEATAEPSTIRSFRLQAEAAVERVYAEKT